MRYSPHDAFVAPARARAELWRTALGYVLINVAHIGLIIALFSLAVPMIGEPRAQEAFDRIFYAADTAPTALMFLGSYAFLIAATLLIASALHKRGAVSLTGPPRLAARQFLRAARALAILYAVLWFLLPDGSNLAPNLPLGRWLALLPLSLAALLIQTGAEELFFRGYLQQQLAARLRSPLLWMGIPALIFAWGHYSQAEAGQNAAYAAIWAGLFAIAASDLTARSGTIGPAVALHLANNAGAILLISLPGPVSGLSLYTYPFTLDSPLLRPYFLIDLGVLAVSWLTVRVALRV